MSIVSHGASSTGFRRSQPANIISSISGGSGAVAAYVITGSPPSATAIGMRRFKPSAIR